MVVLETDEPHPDDHHEKGSLGEILHRHFKQAGDRHDPPLGIETDQIFVVKEKGGRIPAVEEFDGVKGVLITGSMYDAHGDEEWILKLLDLLKSEQVSISIWCKMTDTPELWRENAEMHFSGVCFGHQLLSRLLGCKVKATGEWELGHSAIRLAPIGKKLFRTESDEIHLHQMHQDQVVAPPTVESAGGFLSKNDKVHVWGHSKHTEVQGLYVRNRVFTTQAHMAFDQKMVQREIQMRIDAGSIKDKDEEERRKAVETSHLEHDGDVLAMAILRFFHFEDDGLE